MKFMKYFKSFLLTIFTLFAFIACDTDDLRNDVDDLRGRVESLEAQIGLLNENMTTIKRLLEGGPNYFGSNNDRYRIYFETE